MTIPGELDTHELLPNLSRRNAVVLRQLAVEERVIGVEQVEQRTVLGEDVLHEEHGLLLEAPLELVGVDGMQRAVGLDVAAELAGAEPLLDEALDRFARAAIPDHACRLLAQRLGLIQLPLTGNSH